jgi:hypothetical protein
MLDGTNTGGGAISSRVEQIFFFGKLNIKNRKMVRGFFLCGTEF